MGIERREMVVEDKKDSESRRGPNAMDVELAATARLKTFAVHLARMARQAGDAGRSLPNFG